MTAAQPSSGRSSDITMHGDDERSGRWNVAWTDATSLVRQISSPRLNRLPTDAAVSHHRGRQRIGRPRSESTRSGEIPLTPGGALESNRSSADANAA
jgi:hypothetical protein